MYLLSSASEDGIFLFSEKNIRKGIAVKKNILVLTLLILIVFVTGCDSKKQETAGPLPERIISLSPGNTEIAFAIGLGEKIVGVTDYCNYPEEALGKQKIGGFANPNLEAIIALEPDLVLAGNKHTEIAKKLEEMGIEVLILVPTSLEEVYASMELVAAAAGNEENTAKVIAGMKGRMQKVQEKLSAIPQDKRVRVYYEVFSNPLMSAGGVSLVNEVLTLAGGKNIFTDISEGYPKISNEAIIERDPQFILFPQKHGSEESNVDSFAVRPVWEKITAVKNKRIFGVQGDAISRPGPRLIDAVEEVAMLLYPDL